MHHAIRLCIADDHTMVRQALRAFLSLDPDLEIVGEAATGEAAIDLCARVRPDVVLMDLLMPGMGGISAISVIRREYPECEVVALTSVLDEESVVSAVRAGAIAYILKTTDASALRDAIKAAALGQVRLSSDDAQRLMSEVRAPVGPETLTVRELDVLRLIALGHANKEIADVLALGEQTVKTHVSHILAKLQLQSRTQAAIHAMQIGIA